MVYCTVLGEPQKIYDRMIEDIKNAKKEILLETYIFDKDSIGKRFREELVKKAKEGVKVKLLIDAFGSSAKKKFFKELIANGGEVRFFRELRYAVRFLIANHERNHRKLLIIDNRISYIGSINITATCLNWGELALRFEWSLTNTLRNSFYRTWKKFDLFDVKRMKNMVFRSFEILQDFPSGKRGSTEKKYRNLIRNAKSEVLIITPYFVPSRRIIMALKKAIENGASVKLLLPQRSAVEFFDAIVDVFRDRFIGKLSKIGVSIYYSKKFLHSKLLVVDEKFFLLGSSNLDHRSFLHQFEVNILGQDKRIIRSLRKYFFDIQKDSKQFKYHPWSKRRFFPKYKYKFLRWLFRTYENYI